jgi:glycogen debranching enzyme
MGMTGLGKGKGKYPYNGCSKVSQNIIETCYQKSVELLGKNSLPEGFIASSATPHYAAIWARDACITSIGANLTGEKDLIETSKSTLKTLPRLQAPMGQIPAVYWPQKSYWDWGEAGATDASAWFVIAAWHYYKNTDDKKLLKELYPSAQKAFLWLHSQDASNFGLIDSPEAGDWMDSTLNRCGKVMYVNALYYWAALAINELGQELGDITAAADANAIKPKFNLLFWPTLSSNYADLLQHVGYPSDAQVSFPHPCSVAAYKEAAKKRRFYLSHVAYGKFVDICDVLGNSLAILLNLADQHQKSAIIGYFAEKKISHPYPSKCLAEPITEQNDFWGMLKSNVERFQSTPWRNPPFCYHNAGIWPFVGAFYTLAISKCSETDLASTELSRLAQANKLGTQSDWEFPEWLNSSTAAPSGAKYQSWNAGTYIMTYQAITSGKRLFPDERIN